MTALLLLLVPGVAFVVLGLVVIWYLTRPVSEPYANVIQLPPRCERGGPTHVVRCDRPRLFDQDALA